MYQRTEYEMTEGDLEELLDACKAVPAMMIGGYVPASPQENANAAWAKLGEKMGFDSSTVRPAPGKGQRFFLAVPSETAEARKEREAREVAEARAAEVVEINCQIEALNRRLDSLKAEPAPPGRRRARVP